jgi:hypothetical protein
VLVLQEEVTSTEFPSTVCEGLYRERQQRQRVQSDILQRKFVLFCYRISELVECVGWSVCDIEMKFDVILVLVLLHVVSAKDYVKKNKRKF